MIRVRVEWQDAPGVRDTVLARTWCRLAIEAGGRLVTEFLDDRSRSLRGGIYGSVFPLSQWIVENWWFLLNESYRFPAAYGSRDLARTSGDCAWIQRHSMRSRSSLPVLQDAAAMKNSITLDVNDATYSLDVHPDEPLALALRNRLGLTGVKVGCSLEQCGACAVLVNGESTLTCVRPAVDFEGRRIETVEGLGTPESPGPVQQALLDEGAAQCGYCTPGLVVAITALLRKEPHPGDTSIRAALAPHLCRCGAHPRVLLAVRKLAAEGTP